MVESQSRGESLTSMYDEDGNPVPNDLVVLDVKPDVDNLDLILSANWWVPWKNTGNGPEKVILVSASDIEHLTDTNPLDIGIVVGECHLFHVEATLRRYDSVNGVFVA